MEYEKLKSNKLYNLEFLLLIFALFLSSIIVSSLSEVYAKDNEKTEIFILNSAEKFFIALKKSDYKTAWKLLSEKSHKTIINDVYRASKKIGVETKKEDIIKDFDGNGVMFNNYWNAFLKNFDPDVVLEQSRWEMGFVKKNKAEIILTYKKSKRPTRLKMFRENGAWKVGLVETFWTRRY